jgi:hypothetical protein
LVETEASEELTETEESVELTDTEETEETEESVEVVAVKPRHRAFSESALVPPED